jgi:hypothetical protein
MALLSLVPSPKNYLSARHMSIQVLSTITQLAMWSATEQELPQETLSRQ